MGFFNFLNRMPSFSNFSFFKTPVAPKPVMYASMAMFPLAAFSIPLWRNCSIFNWSNSPVNSGKSGVNLYSSSSNSSDFDKMLSFVLRMEGGYANNPYDRGGATNKGITHRTYDSYRKSKGLPTQSVRNISNAEVRDIYYKNYYIASGADRIKDRRLALALFDTAVNMGVGAAKKLLNQSGGDYNRFNQLRRARYQKIAKGGQRRFLKGWLNRTNQCISFANRNFSGNVSYMA